MNLKEEGQDIWNKAYERRGNILFYPHEEIVRFVNKYVRKRVGITEFTNILPLTDCEWKNFRSVDIGCGIGRHIKFLDEFGLNPYGIDLSNEAIEEGKGWMNFLDRKYLADKMIVGSVTSLPYQDGFFDLGVSHGLLDVMSRSMAEKGLDEILRVLKKGGLMYLDFYMDCNKGDTVELVKTGFDEGTIKSYFTVESLREFIGVKAKIVDLKIIR